MVAGARSDRLARGRAAVPTGVRSPAAAGMELHVLAPPSSRLDQQRFRRLERRCDDRLAGSRRPGALTADARLSTYVLYSPSASPFFLLRTGQPPRRRPQS